ncbi:putative diacylglycerol O-acyltransferase Tgs4 [compost metagenome]
MNMTLLDMSWFPLESRTIPVHGGFLHVFTPPPGAKADYSRRLLATMKKRAVGAPFNLRPRLKLLGLPYWEEVEVDLANHLVEVRLPAPGNDQQLRAAAAEAIREPLSWSLPLWRCHWIEGLEGGRFAYMLVAHHSQWDGMAVFRLMGETMSESAQRKTIRAPWQGVSSWLKQVAPGKGKKTRPSVLGRTLGALRNTAGAATDMSKVYTRQGWRLIRGKGGIALPLSAPETRFQRNGSGERTYGLARFPVTRVKALAKATGCSFNDVMTTVVDAAYSAFLDGLGMPAGKPLVAMVPMALKVAGAGNQLSGALVTLGAPGSDLSTRLATINRAMGAAKSDIGAMGPAGAKLYAMINMGIAAFPDMLRVGEHLPVTANLLISNPFGVPRPLYLNGSRLEYFVPMLGPSLGTRLMVGIWTYADETFVSLTSLRSVVPDVERLASLVQQSFDELERTIGGSPDQPEPAPVKLKNKTRTAAPGTGN